MCTRSLEKHRSADVLDSEARVLGNMKKKKKDISFAKPDLNLIISQLVVWIVAKGQPKIAKRF